MTTSQVWLGDFDKQPTNIVASGIAGNVNAALGKFVYDHELGLVSGENGGYMVAGKPCIPDGAFISYQKRITIDDYNPDPPDLAVEVVFPTDTEPMEQLRARVSNYLLAGILVWVVIVANRCVEVYQAEHPVKIFFKEDILTGGDVLPGFEMPVHEIFDDSERFLEEEYPY